MLLWNVLGDPFWTVTLVMGLIGWLCVLIGAILLPSDECPVFVWWIIAFQALLAIFAAYSALKNQTHLYRMALVALLAVATMYVTTVTNYFVWKEKSAAAVIAAGAILLSIVNIFWILFLGTPNKEPVHKFVASFARDKYDSRAQLLEDKPKDNS